MRRRQTSVTNIPIQPISPDVFCIMRRHCAIVFVIIYFLLKTRPLNFPHGRCVFNENNTFFRFIFKITKIYVHILPRVFPHVANKTRQTSSLKMYVQCTPLYVVVSRLIPKVYKNFFFFQGPPIN